MNLAPYLEFMLKLQGDCLILQGNQIPKIKLLDKEKTVGKKILKTEYITTFIESLLDNSQNKGIVLKIKQFVVTILLQLEIIIS